MNGNKGGQRELKTENNALVRASISFPPEVYAALETIAREKKVSLAWVVRDAAEQYIDNKWPLFTRRAGESK